jgi:hypothetical protein
MALVPHGLGLFGLFIAIILQMSFGFRSSVAQGRKEKLFVFVTFLLVLIQLFYLSTMVETAGQSKLFRFSGTEVCFAIATMLFFLFSHFNFYFDKVVYEKELGLLQLAAAFLACCAIFSNHFLVLIVSIPTLMLIVFSAPHFSYKSTAKLSLLSGVPWALLFLVVLSLSSALVYQEFHTMDFSELRVKIVEKGISGPQILGMFSPLVLFAGMVLFSAFSFFLPDYERSDSWNLIGQFRMLLPLLGAIMICRWVLMFGGVWRDNVFIAASGFPVQIIPVIVFLLLAVSILIQTVVVKKLSQLVQVFSIQPLLLTLWGLSSGTNDALLKGIAGLFLYAVAVPLCLKIFVVLDIKPFERIDGGRLALRGASFLEKLQIFVLLVILSPLGTHIGYSLVMTTVDPPFQLGTGNLLPAICAASLLFSLVTILGDLFDNYSPRRMAAAHNIWVDQVFGNGILILLITLGIYPLPLYNYVSYILSHSLN